MKLVHELWKDESDGEFLFCLSGPAGDDARGLLVGNAEKVWECEAECSYEAMTKYYEYQEWGEYKTEFEQDHWPYIDNLGTIKNPNAK